MELESNSLFVCTDYFECLKPGRGGDQVTMGFRDCL